MKERGERYVSPRITQEDILEMAHKLWEDSKLALKMGKEACKIIRESYFENPFFFSGRTSKGLVAGLLYILGIQHGERKTQRMIADILQTSEATILANYKAWMNQIGVGRDVAAKVIVRHKWRTIFKHRIEEPVKRRLYPRVWVIVQQCQRCGKYQWGYVSSPEVDRPYSWRKEVGFNLPVWVQKLMYESRKDPRNKG